MDKQWLSQEAERLEKDPVFIEAISRIRADALEKLAGAPIDEPATILSLQATVRVCDGIRGELKSMILSKEDRKPIRAV